MKLAVLLGLAVTVLTGCPSKDNTSSSGATAPSVSTAPTGSAAPSSTPSSGGLAGLDASKAATESWTATEGGAAIPILYWADLNVRLSASCKQPDGSLSCAALTQLKSGPVADVKPGHGGMSMGTRICLKLGNKLTRGKNAAGSEDGFCTFSDGSLAASGTLEQYNSAP